MNQVILDGKKITSRDALHDELSEKLEFERHLAPHSHYGRNLDALYDILTCLDETHIILQNYGAVAENLGKYAELVLTVFKDAAEYNENIKLEILY